MSSKHLASSTGLSAHEAALFLRSLKEEGIEELYLEVPKKPGKSTPVSAAPVISKSEKTQLQAQTPAPLDGDLKGLCQTAQACTQCSLLVKNRTQVVFGSGNPNAKLMFVGEAPGRDEDLQGLPFVGAAGQLLTKIIASIGLDRNEVYIANVLKCRPPNNRPPQPDEIANCEPYLKKQIELIHPKIICCLGTFAAQTVLKTTTPISRLRGAFHDFGDSKLLCTFHPAYLLRNPAEKRSVWEDMKKIRKALDELL